MQQQITETYFTGSELATMVPFPKHTFAPSQHVNLITGNIHLDIDPRKLAPAPVFEINKLNSSARRRGKTQSAQNNLDAKADMSPAMRRAMGRTSFTNAPSNVMEMPKAALRPTMQNFRPVNSRVSHRGFGALLETAAAVAEVALDVKTGGLASVAAVGMRGPSPAPRGMVINISAAKRAITASPKQMFMPTEMELKEVVEMVPKLNRERMPGAKVAQDVIVMRPKKKLVWAPKMALAPTG